MRLFLVFVLVASCSPSTAPGGDASTDASGVGPCGQPLTGYCFPYLYAQCWELEGRPPTSTEMNEGCVAGGGTWNADGGCSVTGTVGRCVLHDDGGPGCETYFYSSVGSNMAACEQQGGSWF